MSAAEFTPCGRWHPRWLNLVSEDLRVGDQNSARHGYSGLLPFHGHVLQQVHRSHVLSTCDYVPSPSSAFFLHRSVVQKQIDQPGQGGWLSYRSDEHTGTTGITNSLPPFTLLTRTKPLSSEEEAKN